MSEHPDYLRMGWKETHAIEKTVDHIIVKVLQHPETLTIAEINQCSKEADFHLAVIMMHIKSGELPVGTANLVFKKISRQAKKLEIDFKIPTQLEELDPAQTTIKAQTITLNGTTLSKASKTVA